MQINPTRIILLTLCATALGITALALNSQPNGSKTQDQEAAQEGPVLEQPLPEHNALTATAGKWTGNLTMAMPDGTKMDYPATETNTAIGAFWNQSTFSCLFMGTPYTGTGSMGYNPKTKRYIGTWVDSMSSFFALMEGEMSSDGKTGRSRPFRHDCPPPLRICAHGRLLCEHLLHGGKHPDHGDLHEARGRHGSGLRQVALRGRSKPWVGPRRFRDHSSSPCSDSRDLNLCWRIQPMPLVSPEPPIR